MSYPGHYDMQMCHSGIDTFIISCLAWEQLRSTIPECQRDTECALCPEH